MKFTTKHHQVVSLSVQELEIINFIERVLGVEYCGYMTPTEFIDALYQNAKEKNFKSEMLEILE